MKKVGFITCEQFSKLYYDDQHLIPIFRNAGIEIMPVIWDQPFNYEELDLLIFRSAWDYHHKTEEFANWLTTLKNSKTPIYNSPEIIEQNYDKHYLKDLQNQGYAIIPTLFYEEVSALSLQQLLKEKGWEKAVIKPTISMSAYHTYSFDKNNCQTLQQNLTTYYGKNAVMVQKFTPEITTEGEWSIVFFDKKYCMSALKKPKKGDFRVQGELGGTVQYLDPPALIIEEAKVILDYYPTDILYARMDGIIHNGHFQLMEAELIDPELYFRAGEKVQKAFLRAVQARL